MNADFTKLNVFFDTAAGGVNQLDGTALPRGVDSFFDGSGGPDEEGALQQMDGLRFDAGFDADHFLLLLHGTENGVLDPPTAFWAMSAHYADLKSGAGGEASGLGMQLAPQGLPHVLRLADSPELSGNPIIPIPALDGPTEELISAESLPNLGRGQLIDMEYVLSDGGASDNSGAGAIAPELPFALDVDLVGDPGNSDSHRAFSNVIDLEMAIDNSNVGLLVLLALSLFGFVPRRR